MTLVRSTLVRSVVAAALVAALPASSLAQTASASTVKAAFLYNFAKFAEWPADALAPGQRLSLCVIGDAAVADALEQTIKGRAHEGHELTVEVVAPEAPLRKCHLLYVDGRDPNRTATVLASIKGAPVLSASDGARFAEQGGVAQLIVENERMRFAINVTAADRSRIRLSSRLLGLATIVRDGANGQN